MLNIFPIMYLSLFAYTILRVFVGLILFYLGFKHYKYKHELQYILKLSWFPYGLFITWIFIFTEIIVGGLFVLGAYTQIAALITIIMCIKMLVMRNWFDHHTIPSKLFYVLLLGVSISIFITGAGAIAFDLPI